MAEAGNSIGGWILSYLAARADRYDTVPRYAGDNFFKALQLALQLYLICRRERQA
jgi:hypothetical protein